MLSSIPARGFALLLAAALAAVSARSVYPQEQRGPDTVVVPSGTLSLRGMLWRPKGNGPFPAVLFNHGAGQGMLDASGTHYVHSMEWQIEQLGPVFARHGYIFLAPLRRGTGLSIGEGTSSSDRWDQVLKDSGQDARNRLQLQLLQTVELQDAQAGLSYLRALPAVDQRRIAVVGHSFGGSLTLLMAARDSGLRAAVVFSGSAKSWPTSAALRELLLRAVDHSVVPISILFAANDYSLTPARALDAELTRLGKHHRMKIYPAVGKTVTEGHAFIHMRMPLWEPDVFAFLDSLTREAGRPDH